jgi:hypothetical protein
MRLRTLLIGVESQNPEIENVQSSFEAPSLFDFEIVIVDVDSVFPADWRKKIPMDEYRSVDLNAGHWFRKGLQKLQKETELLMQKGGMLICLLRPMRGVKWQWFDSSERRDRTEFENNYDWIPIENLDGHIVSGFGRVIKLCDEPGSFARYLKMTEAYWTAYIEDIERLKIKHRNIALNDAGEPIAAEVSIGKGSIVFLPLCEHANMSDILVECATSSFKKSIERPPPTWTEKIRVPNEDTAQKSLDALAKKISELQAEYDTAFAALEEKTRVKKLLYEKDEPLEEAVKKAFEELGFTLTKKGDKDWIASSDVGEAILEVTGSEGSIDIDKLRQLLDYWIDDYKESGVEKKAILVGNHFANDPPEARGEPFTEKVLETSKVYSMCLIPALELFNVILSLREGKVKTQDIRKKIIETVGIFQLT